MHSSTISTIYIYITSFSPHVLPIFFICSSLLRSATFLMPSIISDSSKSLTTSVASSWNKNWWKQHIGHVFFIHPGGLDVYSIYIYIHVYVYNCEPPSQSIADASYENLGYRFFFCGALSLYSVVFKSTLNNANMQRNWLHGFRSLNCRGWIKGALVIFAFATMLRSYLSTFPDSFLSKDIYYNFNSKLEWQ